MNINLYKPIYIIIGVVLTSPAFSASNIDSPTTPWGIYGGGAYAQLPTSATVKTNDSIIPGADAKSSNNTTIAGGITYQFTPNWSGEFAGGIPPTTTISGKGTLASANTIGKITYAPAVFSVRFNLFPDTPIQPYIGAGINWTLIMNTKDGFVQNFKVRNAIGPVVQLGFEVPMNKKLSLVVDAKKIWIDTKAKGNLPALGGSSATADIHIAPLVTMVGLSYQF